MNRTEMHPVELLLVLTVVVLEAAITLLVALAALVLALAQWTPAAPAATPSQVLPAAAVEPIPAAPAVPLVHPLQQLAVDALRHLPVAQLRQRARAAGLPRSLSRSARKVELVSALAGLETALI